MMTSAAVCQPTRPLKQPEATTVEIMRVNQLQWKNGDWVQTVTCHLFVTHSFSPPKNIRYTKETTSGQTQGSNGIQF